MKDFKQVSFLPSQCRHELDEFGKLLGSHQSLLERKQIKPFFQNANQLAALLGIYALASLADLVSYEFEIAGDFRADIVVGSLRSRSFCMVEFEEGGLHSIFTRRKPKSTKEWSRQFNHGFSQLVDWFYALDDLTACGRSRAGVARVFRSRLQHNFQVRNF
jgi:hypothetical protein